MTLAISCVQIACSTPGNIRNSIERVGAKPITQACHPPASSLQLEYPSGNTPDRNREEAHKSPVGPSVYEVLPVRNV